MPRFTTGTVVEVVDATGEALRLQVKVGRKKRFARAFVSSTGPIAVGDEVILNTTATDLDLGTGGDDFVLWNVGAKGAGVLSGGHILKMRYTPWQHDVVAAEAPESPHHEKLATSASLDGMPVIACGLHSQIAPAVAMLKHVDPDLRIAYVMTDGAALPIAYSESVRELVSKSLIDATVTCGHAFGGDYEAVNVYSALVIAADVVNADVAVVAMGPGIVGTGTMLGHTGMEQGQVLAAAGALGGQPIAALRISFADERERHRSVSHHTLTSLRFGALMRSTIAVPDLEIEKLTLVMEDLIEAGLFEMHDVRMVDAWETEAALQHFELAPRTMGRGFNDDPAFFEAAGAAGLVAAELIYEVIDA